MSEESEISIISNLRGTGGDTVTLRQIALGVTPLVLIEMAQGDEGGLNVNIDATGPGTATELTDFLDMVTSVIRENIDTNDFPSWDIGDGEPEDVLHVEDYDGMSWHRLDGGMWRLSKFDAIGATPWGELVRRNGPLKKLEV